jgi:hypothetical protein
MSTGNSLDMTPEDEEIIKANDATIKDMEVSFHITRKHFCVLIRCVKSVIANVLMCSWYLRNPVKELGATVVCHA